MINYQFALVAWIPAVLLLFSLLPARRAVLYAIIGGMLFLPERRGIVIPLLPYGKLAAVAIAPLIGIFLFDGARLLTFRFRWFDTFWLLICTSSMVSSIDNGLGFKDGVVESIANACIWGIPYFIGRIYLTDLAAVREAAIAFFVAGLVYAPLCLFEVRFSPQLHNIVYGFHQHSFAQTMRWGGFRPAVFMQHGLAVGLFMSAATLTGIWLWTCGTLKQIGWLPMSWAVVILVVVTLLCKSTGGLVLLAMGGAALLGVRYLRTAIPLLLLAAVPPTYMYVRASGLFDGRYLVAGAAEVFNEERALSLQFRINAENLLTAKALQKPLFGWGGWSRSRVFDEWGHDIAVTDGMWVITLGKKGLVGLVALFGAFLVGPIVLRWRYDAKLWTHPAVGPAVVMAVAVVLHMIDSLPNGMPNSIYYFVGGGLAGMAGMNAPVPVATRRQLPARGAPGTPARATPVVVRPVST